MGSVEANKDGFQILAMVGNGLNLYSCLTDE